MKAGSVNRFEAWALIVGPVVALVFFLVEPGGMLIDSTASTDYIGKVRALASNSAMAHVAALMVPLGLIVMIYGLTGLNRLIVLVEDDFAAAVSRFGTLSVTMGGFGWIMADGLIHILAETRIQSEQALQAVVPIAQAGAGITFISSIAVSLGVMALSLGLSARDPVGFNKVAALVIPRGVRRRRGRTRHRPKRSRREHGHPGQALLLPLGALEHHAWREVPQGRQPGARNQDVAPRDGSART